MAISCLIRRVSTSLASMTMVLVRSSATMTGCLSATRAAGAGARGFEEVGQQGHQLGGVGILQRDDRNLLADSGLVDLFQDFGKALDVRLHIGDDHGIGRRISQDDAVLGDQGGEEPLDLLRVRVLQGNELRDDLVLGWLSPARAGSGYSWSRIRRRDDLNDLAALTVV
jgi:hypothetical protein